MNLADAQPGVFKMNLDAHLVCHLATTETWVQVSVVDLASK